MIYWISFGLLFGLAIGLMCYGRFIAQSSSQKEKSIVYGLFLFVLALIPGLNAIGVVACIFAGFSIALVAAMQKFVYNEKSYVEYVKKIVGA